VRYSSSITHRKRRGRTEYVAVLSYYDQNGKRCQKQKTSFSSSEAKRRARELEDEYVEGGEAALHSDDLTFEALADHCQQTKYCEAEYDESGNKLFGVKTPVFTKHMSSTSKSFSATFD
jgi:hypothetical protein